MRKRGFTLIELLVVIAIIGILATVVIVNVSGARRRAADAKVLSDLSEAAKVASLCLAGDGTLISGATASTHVLDTATPRTPSATSETYSNICITTNISPGKWPVVSGTGTDGLAWAWRASAIADQNAGTFSFYASTGSAVANRQVYCDQNGCVKRNGDNTTPASW